MNKKLLLPLGVLLVLGLLLYSFFSGSFNKMVEREEVVNEAWANVQNVYQMRFDLVDNLVATVKGVADFEQETLTQVIEARAKASSVQLNAENIDAQSLGQFQQAQGELSSALSRLLVTVERYPELTATKNFSELQNELSRIEQRINIARRDYNESVKTYNTYIRQFPRNIAAALFNFDKREGFASDPGAETAPKVDFSDS